MCSKTKPTNIIDTDQNVGLSICRKLRCAPAILLFLWIVILSNLVKSFVFRNTWIRSKHSVIPRQHFEAGRRSVKKYRTGRHRLFITDWGEMITGHRTDVGQDTRHSRALIWALNDSRRKPSPISPRVLALVFVVPSDPSASVLGDRDSTCNMSHVSHCTCARGHASLSHPDSNRWYHSSFRQP